MAICLKCQKYEILECDHYCGLCGSPLGELWLENGGQFEVAADQQDQRLTFRLRVENKGVGALKLRLQEPQDQDVIRYLDGDQNRELSLPPLSRNREIAMEVDTAALARLTPAVCRIPFVSNDPHCSCGHIQVCFAGRGELTFMQSEINLGTLWRGPSRATPHIVTFTLDVYNEGSARTELSILPRKSNRVWVEFAPKGTVALQGWERRRLELRAWSDDTEDFQVNEDLTFEFRNSAQSGVKTRSIPLHATLKSLPTPQVASIDFGNVLPGQVISLLHPIFNQGSMPFSITGIETGPMIFSPLHRPIVVEPGEDGSTLELLFSTRFGAYPVTTVQELEGLIQLQTNRPEVGTIPVYWSARITRPQVTKGIMAIDFGTENSCVAYLDIGKERPRIIGEDEAHRGIIPSMITFLAPDIFTTGAHAVQNARLYPENVVYNIKRCILEGSRTICGRTYLPQELAALLIEQLMLEAIRQHGAYPERLAMTVPANFWGPRREKMIESCRMAWERIQPAGQKLRVDVIDEPTAAAMHYVWENRGSFVKANAQLHRMLVFDFGGGTLDISIIEASIVGSSLTIQPILARGNNLMGGVDLDLMVIDAMAQECKSKYPSFAEGVIRARKRNYEEMCERDRSLFSGFLPARCTWYRAAKETKEALSKKDKINFQADLVPNERNVLIVENGSRVSFVRKDFSRPQFEKIIAGKIEQTIELLKATLASAYLTPEHFQTVLLAGQTCRIQSIRQAVKNVFPNADIPGEEDFPLKDSVARGAATILSLKAMARGTAGLHVHGLEKTSYRFGILMPSWLGYHFQELIGMNVAFSQGLGLATIPLDREAIAQFGSIIYVAQNAGAGDDFTSITESPKLTVLGHIDLAPDDLERLPGAQCELTMAFSQAEGRLEVHINGIPFELKAPNEPVEALYL